MSKGRTPPPAQTDHAANLRDRLGRAAYEAAFDHEPVPWAETDETRRERYRKIGQAVMDTIVKRDRRRGEISAESIVSAQSGQPFVQFALDRSPTQLTPGKAREVALMLLEAADAAESDALLTAFAREQIGLDQERAAMLVAQLRARREAQRGKGVDAA